MSNCPICNTEMFFMDVLDTVPVSSAQLFNSIHPIEPVKMTVGVCDNCNHITNFNYQPSIYTDSSYITKKSISSSMSNNLKEIIDFLNVTAGISILEIGSGSGELANYFANIGANVTTVDPCIAGYDNDQIQHYQQFFDDSFPNKTYDLIISRHIIEHVSNPVKFLKLCKSKLNTHGNIYIEVPNLESTLTNHRSVDFFNDHVQHFSKHSLSLSGSLAGLIVNRDKSLLNSVHIGVLMSKITDIKIKEELELAKIQYEAVQSQLDQPFTVYGAGAHAATFVGSIPDDLRNNIISVIDKDPNKSGKFVPGTSISIKLPDMINTDLVVNTSILYKLEVEEFLKNTLGFTGKILHL